MVDRRREVAFVVLDHAEIEVQVGIERVFARAMSKCARAFSSSPR
jgi:hypothetical protein